MRSGAKENVQSWLSAFPVLKEARDNAWVAAANTAQLMSIPPGDIIIHQGDACRNFLLVVNGTIRVFQRDASGREITIFRTGGGEMCVCTAMNLLDQTDYDVDAVTESEVQVASIPQEQFQRALAHSGTFRDFVFSRLTHVLRDVTRLNQKMAFHGLDLRLACLLGQLFQECRGRFLAVTHQKLARELGSSREVVSRMLEEFERKGCIRLHRGYIEMIAPDVLAQMSGEESHAHAAESRTRAAIPTSS